MTGRKSRPPGVTRARQGGRGVLLRREPDIACGRRLAPVHPGEILQGEFLRPLGLSVYRLAQALKVPRARLNDIVLGRRAVTPDTALRLGRYFGTTARFWLALQGRYDLEMAERVLAGRVEREVAPRVA